MARLRLKPTNLTLEAILLELIRRNSKHGSAGDSPFWCDFCNEASPKAGIPDQIQHAPTCLFTLFKKMIVETERLRAENERLQAGLNAIHDHGHYGCAFCRQAAEAAKLSLEAW
jgi:hypothetical protein